MRSPIRHVPDVWIDPYCPLLGEHVPRLADEEPSADDADGLPVRRLTHFDTASQDGAPSPQIDGADATLDDALRRAAGLLSTWRQPLFAGLGTDIAGARALTRLALRCGAILDHAHGEAMTQALRAQQDRGGFTTTLAEIHERADLVVCLGVDPATYAADFYARCGLRAPTAFGEPRRVVFVHATSSDPRNDVLAMHGNDLHTTLAELNAAVHQRVLPRGSADWPTLQALANALRHARYAVIVYAPSALPGRHAALLIESIGRLVKTLNLHTRAATIALGPADGAASTQQVATWLTGLPLRTGLHPHGFEHDPHRYATARLLMDRAVDGVLWVSSFDPDLPYPLKEDAVLPAIVLGHPGLAARLPGTQAPRVFIPVATPGVNARGHLFRSDAGVMLPLAPLLSTRLPGVGGVVERLHAMLDTTIPAVDMVQR